MSFTVKATGTEPLNYQWQWKSVVEGVSSREWQNLSSGGSVQGADTATLTYSSIESCSEGLYRCVVTNAVGEGISEYTDYIIGEYRVVMPIGTHQQYNCVTCASCMNHRLKECEVMVCSTSIQVKLQGYVICSMN